jgi:energy-coupling factor transporter ATP-binding protein EcfA2
MTPRPTSNRSNRALLQSLRAPKARFYPFDLHTHSPGSYDVCFGQRYEELPETLRQAIELAFPLPFDETATPTTETYKPIRTSRFPLKKEPSDHCAHDRDIATPEIIEAFFRQLVHRRNTLFEMYSLPASDNWSIVGVTDHNTAHFSTLLAKHAWQQRANDRLIVLPGVELDTRITVGKQDCPLHILCLFQPGVSSEDIAAVINKANSSSSSLWRFGSHLQVTDLAAFVGCLRGHREFPSLCIAAHVWSNKGIEKESKKVLFDLHDAEIARVEGALSNAREQNCIRDIAEYTSHLEELHSSRGDQQKIHNEVLRIIGHCGFDALQIRDRAQETHYRRLHRFRETSGRAVPLIASDAHTPTGVFTAAGEAPFIKLNVDLLVRGTERDVFDEVRSRALRFAETRTTYSKPDQVGYWIEGLEIVPDAREAQQFWEDVIEKDNSVSPTTFTLPLSRNLNCFIGGRGSGKSSLIEAIAFVCDSGDYSVGQRSGRQDRRPDWYRRADATLRGCQLRLVWKTTAQEYFGTLPKKALFVSRYFNPNGEHQTPECRDAEGNAITDSTVTVPRIQLLRAHHIEQIAETDNLRRLLDELWGNDVAETSIRVEELRTKLKEQRQEIVKVCEQLSAITADRRPLRQYGLRKMQFEAVNNPDLHTRFKRVDEALAAKETVHIVSKEWDEVGAQGILECLDSSLTEFFKQTAARLVDESGAVRPGHQVLESLVGQSPNRIEPGIPETLVASIHQATQHVEGFNRLLKDQVDQCSQIVASQQDELARDGLPAGAHDRNAKKLAFDEATREYEKYTELMQQYTTLMTKRLELFDELVAASHYRTQCRNSFADSLTAELARDLDSDVLQIIVRANPLADRKEFSKWSEDNLYECFKSYKREKVAALINSDLMPSTLRDLLLDPGNPDMTALQNDFERAADGRIDPSECDDISKKCRAFVLTPLDDSSNWPPSFTEELPQDLQSGVLVFNRKVNQLTIDQVLQLDEIVIDDQPEILLNDRPNDELSEARPLYNLSPGQRCSAILPLLLLSGNYPLIIDQPEENLDNRLIRQVIVNILASMKLRRQVIIATHNPNLPVLGDAEQCVVLQASGRDRSRLIATGSLDSPSVSRYITDIMEGGREAFQYRQSIYQTHWSSVVEEE